MRPVRWPIVLSLVTFGLVAASMSILLATSATEVPVSWGFRGSSTLFALTAGSVGAVVCIRRPDNRVGWLFVAIGLLFAVEAFVNEYTILAVLVVPETQPGEPGIAWLLTWLWIPPVALALIYLPLVFPTGHLLSARWRPVAWFGILATFLFSAVCAIAPGPIEQATFVDNPFAPSNLRMEQVEVAFGLAVVPLTVSVVLAITSLVRRFRAADDLARRQIKWFALAATVAAVVDTLYYVSFVVSPSPAVIKVMEVLVVVSLLGLPIAAGLAILRYRLYDIDRIISRTLSYAVVTAILGVVFVGVILSLQTVLAGITGNGGIPVAISTLAVFALFQPVLRRVRRAVDRRFDRARYDGERTAGEFAERLRWETDMDRVSGDLRTTVTGAVAPSSLAVWLRSGRASR